jgi:hypothetical protein
MAESFNFKYGGYAVFSNFKYGGKTQREVRIVRIAAIFVYIQRYWSPRSRDYDVALCGRGRGHMTVTWQNLIGLIKWRTMWLGCPSGTLSTVVTLLERWQGPVSLAMDVPWTDSTLTHEAIRYARKCLSPLVCELVTFHVFSGKRLVPKQVASAESVIRGSANCSEPASWLKFSSAALKRQRRRPCTQWTLEGTLPETAQSHITFCPPTSSYTRAPEASRIF